MNIFIIPDTQVKPGVPTNHLTAAGQYIADKQPDVIVHLGDHYDMHSLSSYDKGTKNAEGARVSEDIKAGDKAMKKLMKPIRDLQASQRKAKKKVYKPRMVFLLGNHENRIIRHVNANPELDGFLGFHSLGVKDMGWEVIGFTEMVEIGGIQFSHYFYQPNTGRAYGGKVATKLNNLGFSFVMGHQQGFDFGMKHLNNGKTIRGLVAGSFYQHAEGYKGPQANDHWHGCVMLHDVVDGEYALMELPMKYLLGRGK